LLKKLNVDSENTNMSFSVNYQYENFEWSGKNINSISGALEFASNCTRSKEILMDKI
jgi:predicted NAD/FAD-binding protein